MLAATIEMARQAGLRSPKGLHVPDDIKGSLNMAEQDRKAAKILTFRTLALAETVERLNRLPDDGSVAAHRAGLLANIEAVADSAKKACEVGSSQTGEEGLKRTFDALSEYCDTLVRISRRISTV